MAKLVPLANTRDVSRPGSIPSKIENLPLLPAHEPERASVLRSSEGFRVTVSGLLDNTRLVAVEAYSPAAGVQGSADPLAPRNWSQSLFLVNEDCAMTVTQNLSWLSKLTSLTVRFC